MKTGKKVLLTLLSATCLTAGAFGLVACSDDTADTRDQQIVAAYQLYADAAGDSAMTYEQWLDTIKGEKGDTGATGATGPKGDKGDQGDPGEDGEDGKDGATWLFGAEDPTQSTGKTGDFYLNTTTYDIFVKTNISTWTSQGNIKGSSGTATPGTPGKDGATWLFGTEAPAANAGNAGDFYLDTTTFDVYLKTETTWEKKGTLKGEQGGFDTSESPVVEEIFLGGTNGNILTVVYSDGNEETIEFPVEIFKPHVHEYGEQITILDATIETYGIAFRKCISDGCGYTDFVVLPALEGQGTIEEPKFIFNDGEVVVESTGYGDWVYFKYTAKIDGYLRVTTAVDGWDYSCRFEVYDTEKYDSEYDSYLYNNSSITGYTTKCYLEKGQSAYIKACAYDFTNEDGNYTIDVKLYTEEDTTPRDVYVKGPDSEAIENATVVLYDYERGSDGSDDVYTEVARATSDEDGKVTFNVKIRDKSYYVGVIAPEDTDYVTLDEDYYSFINPLTFVGSTSIRLDKMANFNITVTYPNGDPVEGVKVAFGSSYSYDEESAVATNADGLATIRAEYTSWYVYILDLPDGYEFNKQRLSDTTQTFALQVKPTDLTLTSGSATLSSADAEKRYKITNSDTGYYTVEATSGYLTSLTLGTTAYVTDGKYVYYSYAANVTTNQDEKVTKLVFKGSSYGATEIIFAATAGANVKVDFTKTELTKEEASNSVTISNALSEIGGSKLEYKINVEAGKTYTISTSKGYVYSIAVDSSYTYVVRSSQLNESNKKDGDSVVTETVYNERYEINEELVKSFTTSRATSYITICIEQDADIIITVTDTDSAETN